jgi:CRISPR-associated endonuclease/helicase Cas3
MQTEEMPTYTDVDDLPFLAVSFPVQGRQLPADHGYLLYVAITKHVPSLHSAAWLGIALISGLPWGKGVIALPARSASLRLRPPVDKLGHVLCLAGARLEIDGYPLRLGLPVARPLVPASSLYARIVTIKKFTEPEPFLDAAQRQLTQLGIAAVLEFPRHGHTRSRRIITIHGHKVVGFSLTAHGLSDEDSLKLQSVGLGGRRAMGCGMFNPIVKATWTQEEDAAEAKEA